MSSCFIVANYFFKDISLLEDKLYQKKTLLFLWTSSVISAPVSSISAHYALTKNLCRASTDNEDNKLREIGGNYTMKQIKLSRKLSTAYSILSETLLRFLNALMKRDWFELLPNPVSVLLQREISLPL